MQVRKNENPVNARDFLRMVNLMVLSDSVNIKCECMYFETRVQTLYTVHFVDDDT